MIAVIVIVIVVVGAVSLLFMTGMNVGHNVVTTKSKESSAATAPVVGVMTSVSSASSSSSPSSSTSTSSSSKGASSSGSTIEVTTQFSNGTELDGVYTELALNGTAVATAYTPVTFHTKSGYNYTVAVSDYKDLYFNSWSNGFSSRVILVAANSSQRSLRAIFTTSPQAPPNTPYSIKVAASTMNGTALPGLRFDLRAGGYEIQTGYGPITFNNLEPGLQYQLVAFWYGHYYFRHFSNGDLNRYELVTFNSTGPTSVSYEALYEYVPPSDAATLNIIAKFPNGTQIGTTFNNSNYIQHTPGMWAAVTPPNATSPFTGSDTGGSLLPFVLFANQTYTVQMSNYRNLEFAYWNDTGSTNATRMVTLERNTTLLAIYRQTTSSSGLVPLTWSYFSYLPIVTFFFLAAVPLAPIRMDRLLSRGSVAASRRSPPS